MPQQETRAEPPLDDIVTVVDVGRDGDGIVRPTSHDGRPVYVPFAYPGDRVTLSAIETHSDGALRAEVVHWHERATTRRSALCSVYEQCGGCRLQHIPDDARLALLQQKVCAAFSAQGLTAPDIKVVAGSRHLRRRRARLLWQRRNKKILIGFRALNSHRIVEISDCATLHPAILSVLQPIAEKFRLYDVPESGEFSLAVFDKELDLTLHWALADNQKTAELFSELLQIAGIIRVAIDPELGGSVPAVSLSAPTVTLGQCRVAPPPGAFRQATDETERYLQDRIEKWLSSSHRIADLFAGWGSLSLKLAKGRHLLLADSAADALNAGAEAARRSGCDVRGEVRNLMKRPILADELSHYDSAIIDPPRAGARAQIREIAGSALKRLVYVSCEPKSFARDVAQLTAAGFTVKRLYLIDAFPFTAHVELIAYIER